jgi:hypothetical protein
VKLGLIGGGFKPFTSGHFSLLASALSQSDKVIVFYGLAGRTKGSGYVYSREMSEQIFQIVKAAIEREYAGKVFVELGVPTPIVKIYQAIEAVAKSTGPGLQILSSAGLAPEEISQVSIFSAPDDLTKYVRHLGTPKQEKYFGDLYPDRLSFVAINPAADEDSESFQGILDAVQHAYPGASRDDLVDMVRMRGSAFRAMINARDQKQIEKYLPNFLNPGEKDQVVKILIDNLNENLIREMVRYTIKSNMVLSEALEAHILNFYEDLDMQLGELYEVVDAISEGALEEVTEKMDGQNLTFTVVDGDVQMFSKGATWTRVQKGGLTRAGIMVKYANKPAVRDAYLESLDALQGTVSSSPDLADRLFQNGRVVVETSIQMPGNPNTIVYDDPSIQFIQAVALAPDADLDQTAYRDFIKRAEAASEAGVQMGLVPYLALRRAVDSSESMSEQIKAELDNLLSATRMKKDNTIGDLAVYLVEQYLSALDSVPPELKQKAALRIGTGKKALLTKKEYVSKSSLEAWKQFQALEKRRRDIVAEALTPLEQIIQAMGAFAFRNLEFAIASNTHESGEELRKFVRKVKRSFESGKILADPVKLEKIRIALVRIGDNEALFEKAVEGIVFRWKGKTRKLTGMFTPINRLRSFFEYGTQPATIAEASAIRESKGAFKDEQGAPLTVDISREKVQPTLDHFFEFVLSPLGVTGYRPIGSTGKKAKSGDLDIVISDEISKDELLTGIRRVVGQSNARKLGSNLAIAYPVSDTDEDMVQIDIMMSSDVAGTEWLMTGHDESRVKGVYRNLMLSLIANQISKELSSGESIVKITLSFPGGLLIKKNKKAITPRITDPLEILRILGIEADPHEIASFEGLVSYMLSDDKLKTYLPKFSEYASFMLKRSPKTAQRAIDYVEEVLS